MYSQKERRWCYFESVSCGFICDGKSWFA